MDEHRWEDDGGAIPPERVEVATVLSMPDERKATEAILDVAQAAQREHEPLVPKYEQAKANAQDSSVVDKPENAIIYPRPENLRGHSGPSDDLEHQCPYCFARF